MTDAITKKLDGMESVSKVLSAGSNMTHIPLKNVLDLIRVVRAAHAFMETEDFGKDEDKRIGELADAMKELME